MFKNIKRNKILYLLRLTLATIIFIATTCAFIPIFKPITPIVQINIGASLVRLIADFKVLAMVIIVTNAIAAFLFGRFYCSTICPLGLLQDITGFIFKPKTRNKKNLYYIRYTILALTLAIIIGGYPAILRYLDPYSNFGNIISGLININESSIITFIPLLILIAMVIYNRRFFCATLCPIGTFLGLCSKSGYIKMKIDSEKCKKCNQCEKICPTQAIDSLNIDNERCIRCLKCLEKCPSDAIIFSKTTPEKRFNPKRRDFIATGIIGAVGLTFLLKTKGIANTIIDSFKKRPICPPGAGSPERLAKLCTNCGLCEMHCKERIIKKPNSEYETIHIDFENGKCDYNCKNCSDICPTGAIKKLTLQEKQNCRIGLVKLDYEKCRKCGLCARTCPKGAIDNSKDKTPDYHANLCIGCGACEKICPHNAIEIVSIKEQTQI